jgi:hypothetical protein
MSADAGSSAVARESGSAPLRMAARESAAALGVWIRDASSLLFLDNFWNFSVIFG